MWLEEVRRRRAQALLAPRLVPPIQLPNQSSPQLNWARRRQIEVGHRRIGAPCCRIEHQPTISWTVIIESKLAAIHTSYSIAGSGGGPSAGRGRRRGAGGMATSTACAAHGLLLLDGVSAACSCPWPCLSLSSSCPVRTIQAVTLLIWKPIKLIWIMRRLIWYSSIDLAGNFNGKRFDSGSDINLRNCVPIQRSSPTTHCCHWQSRLEILLCCSCTEGRPPRPPRLRTSSEHRVAMLVAVALLLGGIGVCQTLALCCGCLWFARERGGERGHHVVFLISAIHV